MSDNMFSQVKQVVPVPLTEKKFDVMGVNIYKASADNLIVLIHNIQDRIDKLETVPVASSYVDAKVAELNKAMKKVVKELDSRAS